MAPFSAPPRAGLSLATGRGVLLVLLAAALVLPAVALPSASGDEASRAAGAPGTVLFCSLRGSIDPGSAAYLQSCLERGAREGHRAVVLQLDTPGGALDSTRKVVQGFLASPVPVVVWVGPAGAQAGSAGVFLVLAANVATLAPGTNLGAAHPVVGPGGGDLERAGGEELAKKVVNDTVAFAEAIARLRGRNVEWAAQAVRESASVDASTAQRLGVIDQVLPDPDALLAWLDGRRVDLEGGPVTLHTAGVTRVEHVPSVAQRLVHALSQPTVAYLLFLLGGLGLAVELSHPGAVVPGVVGVTCLLLSLVAFSVLPVRAGAVLLLVLGAALVVAELFVASGFLGAGGVGALALGGLLLIDRVDPGWFVERSFRVPLQVWLPSALALGGAGVYVALRAAQTRRLPQQGGAPGLVGEHGRTLSALTPEGEVRVHDERWHAVANHRVPPGAAVRVRAVQGLTLHVEEVPS